MTPEQFLEALRLLDSATDLLDRCHSASATEFRSELQRMSLALDLLRLRIGQAPAASERN